MIPGPRSRRLVMGPLGRRARPASPDACTSSQGSRASRDGDPAAPPPPPPSQVRQNHHPECEAALNKRINLELPAFCVYLSMAFCFNRQEVPSKRFPAFFLWRRREEWKQTQVLMRLQNQRGERVRLGDIPRPDRCRWESGRRAMKSALHRERMVSESLLHLFPLATIKNDAHLCDFLERPHLRQDAKFVRNLAASTVNLSEPAAAESRLAELPL